MTPTEQDDELTKSISRLMYKLTEDHEGSIGTTTGHNALIAAHITNFMQLITADRKRVALEARIEALQWALDDFNMPDTDTRMNLQGYINELKAQQEEV